MNQKDLIGKILQASNTIAKSANRGSANHLVVSSYITDKLQHIFRNENRKEKIKELWGINSDTTKHI